HRSPFCFTYTPTTEIYTLSLHDALPILAAGALLLRGPGGEQSDLGQSEDATRQAAGVLAVADHESPVDDDVLDRLRVLMRRLVGRPVSHAARLEHDQVGLRPRTDHAAIGQAESARGKSRHLVDRVGEREHALLSHVLAQHSREGAVAPRMGPALSQLAVRR